MSERMTEERLAKIEQAVSATPPERDDVIVCDSCGGWYFSGQGHIHQSEMLRDVPDLVAEVRALRAEVADLTHERDQWKAAAEFPATDEEVDAFCDDFDALPEEEKAKCRAQADRVYREKVEPHAIMDMLPAAVAGANGNHGDQEDDMLKRQGDLLFVQLPKSAKPAKAKPNPDGGVLARGEATGHAHAIEPTDLDGCDVFLDAQGRLVVEVKRGRTATVRHEEHGPIELEPGAWEVRRQREYESAGWRMVTD